MIVFFLQSLFDACSLPAHYGGLFVRSRFEISSGGFVGDYHDAESMCAAMWSPQPGAIWKADNITLEEVADEEQGVRSESVAFERVPSTTCTTTRRTSSSTTRPSTAGTATA